jgi:hypothetical protein
MTLVVVYTRPELALLATDTRVEERGTVPGVATPDWPLLTIGTGSKLEWSRAGWFAGSGVGPWIAAIAPVLRALTTFDEAPHALRAAGERLMGEWNEEAPELAAHVRADRMHWFLLSADAPTARVLNWDGTAPFTLPHGKAAGCGPPTLSPLRLQTLLNGYSSSLRTAASDPHDPHHASCATTLRCDRGARIREARWSRIPPEPPRILVL